MKSCVITYLFIHMKSYVIARIFVMYDGDRIVIAQLSLSYSVIVIMIAIIS